MEVRETERFSLWGVALAMEVYKRAGVHIWTIVQSRTYNVIVLCAYTGVSMSETVEFYMYVWDKMELILTFSFTHCSGQC